MAARVLRELTADEVERHGGFRVGNFGTGGRTYHNETRGSSASCNLWWCRSFAVVIALIAAGFWYTREVHFRHVGKCVEYASETALPLLPPLTRANSALQEFGAAHDYVLFVRVSSTAQVPTGSEALDPFFGIDAGPHAASLRRVTEYCQWQEFSQTSKTLVGRVADCQGGDECNIYDTKTSFYYIKGWHSRRIDSTLFDNPVAYRNSGRDPCPSHVFSASKSIALEPLMPNSLEASPSDVAEILPWTSVPIVPHMSRHVAPLALQHGFHEIDSRYIYSRGGEDGWVQAGVHAAASYLIDGVVGTDFLSTCKTGDIRVRFEKTSWDATDGFSMVGKMQPNGVLTAFRIPGDVKSGACHIGRPGNRLDLDEMLDALSADEAFWIWVVRSGLCVALMVSVWLWRGAPWPWAASTERKQR